MDIELEARHVIAEHTKAYMDATDYTPDNVDDMKNTMLTECSYILTEDFLDGKYTPLEYNAIRNEIAKLLYAIFSKAA